jgi:hypothetical protein
MSRRWLLGCLGLGLCACSGTAGPSDLALFGRDAQPISASLALDNLVSTHQSSASSSVTSPAFTTSQAGELLIAFMGSDGPANQPQTIMAVTGGDLSWRLRQRSNGQAGDAEIWQAVASTVVTGVTVTATRSSPSAGSIVVATFTGANTTLDGATSAADASTGSSSASVATKTAGSLVWGVGNDWDSAVARVVGPNQTKADEYLSVATGDTWWVQNQTTAAGPSGSVVTIDDTAPTADRWNLALIEIPPSVVDTTPRAPGNPVGAATNATSLNRTWPTVTPPENAAAAR